MKFTTFSVAVAVVCIGVDLTHAQTRSSQPQRPTPAQRIASGAYHLTQSDTPQSAAEINPIDNPFDFLEEAAPGPAARPSPTPAAPSPSDASESADPKSLPVTHEDHRGLIDSIVDQATLASVMNASDSPVFWTQSAQTPNPVASILLREQCVQGLWDGYAAQRAQECAAMWAHLNGHQHCGHGCGTCGGNACGTAGCPCPTGSGLRNRYREACDAAPAACGCSDCGSQAPLAAPLAQPQVLPVGRPQASPAAGTAPAERVNVATVFAPLIR